MSLSLRDIPGFINTRKIKKRVMYKPYEGTESRRHLYIKRKKLLENVKRMREIWQD